MSYPILFYPILFPPLDVRSFDAISIGGNSIKTDSTNRTIAGFSNAKLTGEKWFDIYTAYWGGNKLYADSFTTSACKGTGDFAAKASNPTISTISRIEGCKKGAAYHNVWMYVIHEMEAAIKDCKMSVATSTHWDEAVAFYTGSTTLVNPTTNTGVFQYGLAEKRCPIFNTCTVTGDDALLYKSAVNQKVLGLFSSGRSYQAAGRCSNMETVKESLVKQFTVPLVQGVLQYLYLSKTGGTEKQKAELWSFAAALLPVVNYYSPSAATSLKTDSYIRNDVTVPSGYVAAKASLESVYTAMGISCADVGGYVDASTATGYAVGMEPCSDATIVGYTTDNDVTQHLRLDKDQTLLVAALATPDFITAYKWYSMGKIQYDTIRYFLPCSVWCV